MRCECNIYFCQLGRKVSSGKFGEQTKDNLYDITSKPRCSTYVEFSLLQQAAFEHLQPALLSPKWC